MGIGYRIKEARERMGLTQTELGALIGVTGSAITNYEKETSHPKEQIIYKLMETLNVDANYLFQDAVKIKKQQNDVTLAEYDHIKKYRDLDDHGREMVDFTLTKEWERSTAEKKAGKVIPLAAPAASALDPNAAHAISGASAADQKHDDDIMDDENF
nr:MAG TPA: helix-turn-helix domain protein [Caudoviricetes sp.]